MANRVYWKGARLILAKTAKYIERYDLQLEENLTAPQFSCLQDVLTAINSCLALLPVNEPDDPAG